MASSFCSCVADCCCGGCSSGCHTSSTSLALSALSTVLCGVKRVLVAVAALHSCADLDGVNAVLMRL